MQDDQVVAEINVGTAQYYENTSNILIHAQVISRDGAAHSMLWNQARLSIASNRN
jgi:hypothetical protein